MTTRNTFGGWWRKAWRERGAPAGLAALIVAAGCAQPRPAAERAWAVMGTYASVSVPAAEQGKLDAYAAESAAILQDLEGRLSMFSPTSEVSRVSQAAGGDFVPVSEATAEVLGLAVHYGAVSRGAFDVTIAPLVLLWGFNGGKVPEQPLTPAEIAPAQQEVGYAHLVVSNLAARLDRPGMKVDLGGIAKGYAVDVCYRKLMDMGARSLMVNLGGNLRCAGSPRGRGPWRIAVRNPFDAERMLGTLALSDGMAAASSGNYERFVTIGGERYAHIINPRTGYPVKGMAGTTVVTTSAVQADAMSTTLFVLGMEDSKPVLAGLPDCHALFVPDRQPIEIWITPGFKKYFTPAPEFADKVKTLE